MNEKAIKDNLEKAISVFFDANEWLLTHDLSEQCMAHKFAEKIQLLFEDYDVDCEYNGNIDRPNGKKKIHIVRRELERSRLLKGKEFDDIEREYYERAVFPDIIIHKRGTNKENICIIEVKKSSSSISYDYDKIKLKCYTSDIMGNDLNYRLGAFVCFVVGESPSYSISYCKEGKFE